MFKRKYNLLRMQGLTLLELMTAMSMSLVLLGLLIEVYLALEKHHKIQAALYTLHARSNRALQIISNEIQLAGFMGCPLLQADFTPHNSTAYVLNFKNKLHIYTNAQDSDVITLTHRSLSASFLRNSMVRLSEMEVSDLRAVPGDILIIADCQHADILQVAEAIPLVQGGQKIISTQPLSMLYDKKAELGFLESFTFQIEQTGRFTHSGQPIYALYKSDLLGHKTELVEGIQKLKFLVDVKNSGQILEGEPKEMNNAELYGISIKLEASQASLIKTEYFFVAMQEGESNA